MPSAMLLKLGDLDLLPHELVELAQTDPFYTVRLRTSLGDVLCMARIAREIKELIEDSGTQYVYGISVNKDAKYL